MSETLLVEPTKPALSELTLCNDELAEPSERFAFSTQNLDRLKAIQQVICLEEGRSVSVDDVLNRVLTFYRRFVPFD